MKWGECSSCHCGQLSKGVVNHVRLCPRSLRLGDPVALLPLLHFTLLKFSRHVAQCIHKAGYEVRHAWLWHMHGPMP